MRNTESLSVQKKLIQYCKLTILQLKKKKRRTSVELNTLVYPWKSPWGVAGQHSLSSRASEWEGFLFTQHLPSPSPLQPEDQWPLPGHLRVHPHDLTNGGMMTVLFDKYQPSSEQKCTMCVCSSLMLKSNPKWPRSLYGRDRLRKTQQLTQSQPARDTDVSNTICFPGLGFCLCFPQVWEVYRCGIGTWGLSPNQDPWTPDT